MTVFEDMRATAQAHEQWAQSLEATADEAATSTVFAAQIRDWLQRLQELGAVSVEDCAIDPVGETGTKGTTRVKAFSSSTSTPPAPTEDQG